MNKKTAFTLIELLIALSLSSFIITGMMLAYRNVMKKMDSAREILLVNRKMAIFFSQVERDFSTAFIPVQLSDQKMSQPSDEKKHLDQGMAEKEEKKEESTEKLPSFNQANTDDSNNDKKRDLKKEKLKNFFIAQVQEDTGEKFGNEKLSLLKKVSFICGTPVQLYGNKKPFVVRVGYEVVSDKEKSRRFGKPIYNVLRKETFDLANAEFKEKNAEDEKEQARPVSVHVVADYVKGLFIKFSMHDPNQKNEGDNNRGATEEKELFTSQTWGDAKEVQGIVPHHVELYFQCWDQQAKRYYENKSSIQVFSYPTNLEQEPVNDAKAASDSPPRIDKNIPLSNAQPLQSSDKPVAQVQNAESKQQKISLSELLSTKEEGYDPVVAAQDEANLKALLKDLGVYEE